MARKEVNEKIDVYSKALEKAFALPDLLDRYGIDPRLLERLRDAVAKAAELQRGADLKKKEFKALESKAEGLLGDISEAMRFVRRVARLDAHRSARKSDAEGGKAAAAKGAKGSPAKGAKGDRAKAPAAGPTEGVEPLHSPAGKPVAAKRRPFLPALGK